MKILLIIVSLFSLLPAVSASIAMPHPTDTNEITIVSVHQTAEVAFAQAMSANDRISDLRSQVESLETWLIILAIAFFVSGVWIGVLTSTIRQMNKAANASNPAK